MNRSIPSNIRLACWTVGLIVLMAIWGQWAADLRAQQEDPAADEPAEAVPTKPEASAEVSDETRAVSVTAEESLGGIVFSSGQFGLIFYFVLAVFSLVALTVILERLVNLQRSKVIPPEFVQRLHDLVNRKEDNLGNLRSLADGSNSPIARILKAGIFRAGRPLPEVEKAMEDALAKESAAMRGRNRPLSVVGSIAPLVGLLGTVVGMIFAFMISSQEGLGKAELLAQGIYLALMTTAAGLTIAIPSLLFSAWFNASVERFMRDVDEALLETLPAFARMEGSPVNGPVGASAAEPVSSTTT